MSTSSTPRLTSPKPLLAAVMDAANKAGIGVVVCQKTGRLSNQRGQELVANQNVATWVEQGLDTDEELGKYRMSARSHSAGRVVVVALQDTLQQDFHRLVEFAPDAVGVFVQGRLVYANQSLATLMGRSREVLLDTSDEALLHPDDFSRLRKHLQGAKLHSDGSVEPESYRVVKEDGSSVSVELFGLAAQWLKQPAMLWIARDLQERKQALVRNVESDRMAAVGTMAAGVAHEVNNPLAYVLLSLQYLIRDLPKLGTDTVSLPALADRLSEARHGAERVAGIVRDLRSLAKGTTNNLLAVNLAQVLDSAIRMTRHQIDPKASLVTRFEKSPAVLGHPARLEQVFVNLLVNAGQALESGSTAGHCVGVSLFPEGDDVVVEISDTGVGIAPKDLDRVFDPFFTTKRAGEGSGLGLPICHRIVSSFGGDISVASRPGSGSVFRVRLPASSEPAKVASVVPPAPRALRRPMVLVVDDELPVVSMLSRVLSDDHDVRIATSAREALEVILQGDEPFDVVLCDLLMPEMDGIDLLAELQRHDSKLGRKVVFMTGGAFTDRAADFLRTNENPRLEKPFDLHTVKSVVHKVAFGEEA